MPTIYEKINEAVILQLALENFHDPVGWVKTTTMQKIRELQQLLRKDLVKQMASLYAKDLF